MGRDFTVVAAVSTGDRFQSTRPVWGATSSQHYLLRQSSISIHAPRVGRDLRCGERLGARINFNPRAPCGARREVELVAGVVLKFQSTRPVWGATPQKPPPPIKTNRFQSTRPVWGATSQRCSSRKPQTNFNPRAPCGARLYRIVDGPCIKQDFNPRAPCGARPASCLPAAQCGDFNPRAPCGARLHFLILKPDCW